MPTLIYNFYIMRTHLPKLAQFYTYKPRFSRNNQQLSMDNIRHFERICLLLSYNRVYMLEIQRIRQEKETILIGLAKRNVDASQTIADILETDQNWRAAKTQLDQVAAEMNQLARSIGELFKSGKQAEATALKEKTSVLKTQEAELKEQVNTLENRLQTLLYTLPNVPHQDVVQGKDAEDNQNEISPVRARKAVVAVLEPPRLALRAHPSLSSLLAGFQRTAGTRRGRVARDEHKRGLRRHPIPLFWDWKRRGTRAESALGAPFALLPRGSLAVKVFG